MFTGCGVQQGDKGSESVRTGVFDLSLTSLTGPGFVHRWAVFVGTSAVPTLFRFFTALDQSFSRITI